MDNQKTDMQMVADAAALAGANAYVTSLYAKKNGRNGAETNATKRVNEYVAVHAPDISGEPVVSFQQSPPTVTVELNGKGSRTLTKLEANEEADIKVLSVATTQTNPGAACVIGLATSAAPAVRFKMSGAMTANDCAVWSNSSLSPSLDGNGSGTATASRFCAAGAANAGTIDFSVSPESNCEPVKDPLAGYAMPSYGSCDYTNYISSGSGTVYLNPGVYCGGLKFNSQVTVELAAGEYIIKDGPFTMIGGSTVVGSDVTLFLTGTNSGLKLGGSAQITLTAPTTGNYAGIAIFSDRDSPVDSSWLGGSSSLDIEGTVYLPNQDLEFTGSNSATAPANYTVLIARTVTFSGSSDIAIRSDFGASSVPVPQSVLMARTQTRLIK